MIFYFTYIFNVAATPVGPLFLVSCGTTREMGTCYPDVAAQRRRTVPATAFTEETKGKIHLTSRSGDEGGMLLPTCHVRAAACPFPSPKPSRFLNSCTDAEWGGKRPPSLLPSACKSHHLASSLLRCVEEPLISWKNCPFHSGNTLLYWEYECKMLLKSK